MPYVPQIISYAIVVLCETLRNNLMISILNDLHVKVADTMSAFITASG